MITHGDPAINAALQVAQRTHPYYTAGLGALRIVADDNVATMATSREWVTHYNPATVAGWTTAETAAVLVHELEHLLRKHAERCGDREHGRFNVAADAEINQRLDGLPDGAVYPEALGMPRGLTAEAYYGATGQDPEQDPDGDPGDPGDGDPEPGDGSGDGAGQSQPGSGQPRPGSGQCGSAAGGPLQDHEQADGDNPGDGAANPDAVRQAVAERAMLQRAQGGAPGTAAGIEIRQWAESTLGIDRAAWYRALATVISRSMAQVGAPTRWTWPGRRDPRDVGGAVLPRWTGTRPQAAVIIDTSSSISPSDLDMAVAAAQFLSRVADVTYYGCSNEATRYGRTLPPGLVGHGGTNLERGIEMAVADGARAVIVITDVENFWRRDPYMTVPLIIGANASRTAENIIAAGPGGSIYSPPEWARVVPIRQRTA